MSDQDVADVRRPGGRTVTEQNGNNKPNDAEGLAFPLSGNEKLIEEAKHLIEQAGSFREQVGDDASPTSMIGLWLRTADALHAALAVFEKAHAHECEMCRWENGFGARKPLTHTCEKNLSTDDFPHGHPEMDPTDEREDMIAFLLRDHNFEESPWGHTYTDAEIANALRHSVVQGEPSDAQVNRDYLAQVTHKAVYSRIPLDDLTDEEQADTYKRADAVVAALRAAGVGGAQ